jgi:hypothetical protein
VRHVNKAEVSRRFAHQQDRRGRTEVGDRVRTDTVARVRLIENDVQGREAGSVDHL